MIPIGNKCTVHGLKSKSALHLNQQKVTIVSWIEEKGRYQCLFEDGTTKNIKECNLLHYSDPATSPKLPPMNARMFKRVQQQLPAQLQLHKDVAKKKIPARFAALIAAHQGRIKFSEGDQSAEYPGDTNMDLGEGRSCVAWLFLLLF